MHLEQQLLLDILKSSSKRQDLGPTSMSPPPEKRLQRIDVSKIFGFEEVKHQESIATEDALENSTSQLKRILCIHDKSGPATVGTTSTSNDSNQKESIESLKALLAIKEGGGGKMSKNGQPKKDDRSVLRSTDKKTKKKKLEKSPSQEKYAGSKFMSSPDPNAIPLPDFEEKSFFDSDAR